MNSRCRSRRTRRRSDARSLRSDVVQLRVCFLHIRRRYRGLPMRGRCVGSLATSNYRKWTQATSQEPHPGAVDSISQKSAGDSYAQ